MSLSTRPNPGLSVIPYRHSRWNSASGPDQPHSILSIFGTDAGYDAACYPPVIEMLAAICAG